MRSSDEPNNYFGGMAVPSWKSPEITSYYNDPTDQYSWLFKIELQGEQIHIHKWKCIDKSKAIRCYKDYGPRFGGLGGEYGYGYGGYGGYGWSHLPSNNNYYKKLDLNKQMKNENPLLFTLKEKISINFPSKVIGKIMAENDNYFQISELEVFVVQK